MRYSLVLVGPVTCLDRAQIFDGLKSYHIRSRSLDQVHCYVLDGIAFSCKPLPSKREEYLEKRSKIIELR